MKKQGRPQPDLGSYASRRNRHSLTRNAPYIHIYITAESHPNTKEALSSAKSNPGPERSRQLHRRGNLHRE